MLNTRYGLSTWVATKTNHPAGMKLQARHDSPPAMMHGTVFHAALITSCLLDELFWLQLISTTHIVCSTFLDDYLAVPTLLDLRVNESGAVYNESG